MTSMTKNYTRILLLGMGIGLGTSSTAYGEEEKEEKDAYQSAITWNPLAFVLVQHGMDELEEEAILLGMGVSDFNLRLQHRINRSVGWTLQAEYTQLSLFTKTTYLGVRGGPRFFLEPETIQGWSTTPFLTLGRTIISAGTYSLSSWVVLGSGGEVNYTWLWDRTVLDIGLGAYAATNIGYVAHATTMAGTSAPEQLLAIKPIITIGVGYAF